MIVNITNLSAQTIDNKPSSLSTNINYTQQPLIIGDYSNQIPNNYSRVWVPQRPYTNETDVISTERQANEVSMTTNYLDGYGRPIQTVLWQASPAQKDIVMPKMYDEFGTQTYNFMPYTSNTTNGSFKYNAFADQKVFLQSQYANEQFFYSQTEFEASALRRTLKSYAQGNTWAGNLRGKEIKYQFNTVDDNVIIWSIGYETDFENNIPTSIGVYQAGQLNKIIVIDENGSTSINYVDNNGRIILEKRQVKDLTGANQYEGYDNWLSTYFVYDDFDNLRFIITPKAVKLLRESNSWQLTNIPHLIDELCYNYAYDERGRQIAKKIPGKGWEYMVYDKMDRLVFTQDPNMRQKKQWASILYNQCDRPIINGVISFQGSIGSSDIETLNQLQQNVDDNTTNLLYSSRSNNNIAIGTSKFSKISNDVNINSPQFNTKHFTATASITFNSGFETDNSTDLTAEIVTDVPGEISSENIAIDNIPLPDINNFIPLVMIYYDDYNFTEKHYSTANNNKLDYIDVNLYPEILPDVTEQAKTSTYGFVTGIKVRTLPNPDDLTEGKWMSTVSFYDDKGRIIQVNGDNYKGGTDIITNHYDYTGKILCNYLEHNNPQNADATVQNVKIKTILKYQNGIRLNEIYKEVFDRNDNIIGQKLIATYNYNESGQLSGKELGTKADASGRLEKLNYTYNIRGWLKSINQDFENNPENAPDEWFGLTLSYDWGFEKNQFNGNVSGVQWRSKGDNKQRSYGYGYDCANRFLYADFNQYSETNANWDKTDKVDFTTIMGNGIDPQSAYDDNGNIKSMKQWGLKLNESSIVDDLKYFYENEGVSNKIQTVIDLVNDPQTKLGDFRSSDYSPNKVTKNNYIANSSSTNPYSIHDYNYDGNGNLNKDLNKDIDDVSSQAIQYNILNLPCKILVKGKGIISYVYDALGRKLEKKVVDNTIAGGKINITNYLSGFLYENDEIKSFGHEEGRLRFTANTDNTNTNKSIIINADYFVKDNLGNIRMLLTDEYKQDTYPAATLEVGALNIEKNFYNIESGNIVDKTSIPSLTSSNTNNYENNNGNPPFNNNPTSNVNAISQKLYKLNASSGSKIGLGITLKVMTGDVVNILGKSYYHSNEGSTINNNYPLSGGLTDFINTFVTASSSVITGNKNVSGSTLNNSSSITGNISNWLDNEVPTPSNKPKAYINWILFDEQFNLVASNSNFDAVSDNPDEVKSHLRTVEISKCGYLYVYCSNESDVNVYFDNLQVVHTRGALLETNEYYAFGLAASGISYKAIGEIENNYKFSGNELQKNEFSDGSGLESYDFNARMYDAQIGRFFTIDPLTSEMPEWGTYVFTSDNPINYTDPFGLSPQDPGDPPSGGEEDDYFNFNEQYIFRAHLGYWEGVENPVNIITMESVDLVSHLNPEFGYDYMPERYSIDSYDPFSFFGEENQNLGELNENNRSNNEGIEPAKYISETASMIMHAGVYMDKAAGIATAGLKTATRGVAGVGVIVAATEGALNPNGWQNHNSADVALSLLPLAVAIFEVSNPVGWCILAGEVVYMVGNEIYKSNNDEHKSITEAVFD